MYYVRLCLRSLIFVRCGSHCRTEEHELPLGLGAQGRPRKSLVAGMMVGIKTVRRATDCKSTIMQLHLTKLVAIVFVVLVVLVVICLDAFMHVFAPAATSRPHRHPRPTQP